MCASNLVKIDIDGNVIGHSDWPINPAGFTFHSAIHAALPDAHCVMHVHTTPTMAVCCSRDGLSFSNFYSAQLYGKIAYHDFEGITVHLEEGGASSKVPAGGRCCCCATMYRDDRRDARADVLADVAAQSCV